MREIEGESEGEVREKVREIEVKVREIEGESDID